MRSSGLIQRYFETKPYVITLMLMSSNKYVYKNFIRPLMVRHYVTSVSSATSHLSSHPVLTQFSLSSHPVLTQFSSQFSASSHLSSQPVLISFLTQFSSKFSASSHLSSHPVLIAVLSKFSSQFSTSSHLSSHLSSQPLPSHLIIFN